MFIVFTAANIHENLKNEEFYTKNAKIICTYYIYVYICISKLNKYV